MMIPSVEDWACLGLNAGISAGSRFPCGPWPILCDALGRVGETQVSETMQGAHCHRGVERINKAAWLLTLAFAES